MSQAILAYLALETAQARYQCGPEQLDVEQRAKVEETARRRYALERRILETAEATGVTVQQADIDRACAQIAERYEDRDSYRLALAQIGLDPPGLSVAIRHALRVEAVLARVGARADAVEDQDVRAWYDANRDKLVRPEKRVARQILITINPDYPENTAQAARARLEAIAAELGPQPEVDRFAECALRHSECPSALEGGKLGSLPAGQLYAELDTALFSLTPGALSPVLESPFGLHLIYCEEIEPGHEPSFEALAGRIRLALNRERAQQVQKRWIAELRAAMATNAV